MKKLSIAMALMAGALAAPSASAQLSQHPDKFLGNITTRGQVNYDGIEFISLWNQLTPENESKWSSCEGSRGNFNWWGCDACYNYCREHNIPFKFHCLVWGAQYPGWMDDLSSDVQYNEIIKWLDAIKKRYPDLDLIDVVNEAVPGHQPAPYRDALGGDGVTGYDWIIKAFKLAHDRWPEAILIYNDFNTFQWQTDQFIDLMKTIRDAGAPVDAYGCQSHDLTDISFSNFKNVMSKIQTALRMPMYSSEYDIGTYNDDLQLQQYSDQIKFMWERDYVAGITLWGYQYGCTWTTDGNSGIIRNGVDRPAMTWLREYMASDEAKTTPAPYPGGKKEASLYIRPETPFGQLDVPFNIYVDCNLRTKTLDHIDLYLNGVRVAQLTEAPYAYEYTPTTKNHVDLRAVAYDTEGGKYERRGGFNVVSQRMCFHDTPMNVPGKIEAEDFDIGGDGQAYHDSDKKNEGTSAYRNDSEGVDIVTGGTGYAIGYTTTGEWLEYTIEITEPGAYDYEVYASSGANSAKIKLTLIKPDLSSRKEIAEVEIPNTGSWDNYTSITGQCSGRLNRGTYRLRMSITGAQGNIDYIRLHKRGAGVEEIEAVSAGTYDVFTTTGIYMGEVTLDSDNAFATKVRELTNQSGIYLIRNKETGASQMIKI